MCRGARGLLVALGMLLLAACALLPVSGPNSIDIYSGVSGNGPDYGLVKLTPVAINILEEYGPRSISALLALAPATRNQVRRRRRGRCYDF